MRLLQDTFPPYLCDWLTMRVQTVGVTVVAIYEMTRFLIAEDKMLNLPLGQKRHLEVDHLIVCTASQANTEIAEASHLEVDSHLGGFIVNSELAITSNLYAENNYFCELKEVEIEIVANMYSRVVKCIFSKNNESEMLLDNCALIAYKYSNTFTCIKVQYEEFEDRKVMKTKTGLQLWHKYSGNGASRIFYKFFAEISLSENQILILQTNTQYMLHPVSCFMQMENTCAYTYHRNQSASQ